MLKTEFPAFIAVLIKLLTKLRQCQYLVGCICFYVVLKSWTRAQPLVLSKTLLKCLLTHGKYAEIASAMFCRCQVLAVNSCLLKNGPIFAQNGTYFVLTSFQTSATYFTSKCTCSSWKIIHFCWETSFLFYGNCACVNSHYCGNCLIFKFVMKWLFIHITPTIFLFCFELFSHLFVSLSARLFLLKATLTKNISFREGIKY